MGYTHRVVMFLGYHGAGRSAPRCIITWLRALRPLGFAACVGCGAAGSAPENTTATPLPGQARSAPPPAAAWPSFEAAGTWELAHDEAFVSRGHFDGSYVAEVRASPSALPSYRALAAGASFAEGAAITMRHRAEHGALQGALFVAECEATGWRFFQVDERGLLTEPEREPLCARCHADAPYAGLFGLPPRARAATESPAPAPSASSSARAPAPSGSSPPERE